MKILPFKMPLRNELRILNETIYKVFDNIKIHQKLYKTNNEMNKKFKEETQNSNVTNIKEIFLIFFKKLIAISNI